MKQTFNALLILAICLILAQNKILAQDGTLTVYATPTTLDEVINGDTTATGEQAHSIYKLVSLDTTYIYMGSVTVSSDISIIGEPDPTTGRLPCIQPGVLSDNSIPANFITMTTPNTEGTFKNLYLLGLSINGSAQGGDITVQVSADHIKIVADNVVFDEWQNLIFAYSGNWDKFFITNCKFRNMVHPNQWYIGEALRNTWPGNAFTDSVVMRYNTFLCMNGYAAAPVTKYYMSYFDFSNNSVIYTFKNPMFVFNITEAKINNNIFFSNWAGGSSKTEYPWWDQLWSPEVGSVIDIDTLNKANAADFGVDTNDVNWRWLAEAKREIEVKNNAYFWPEKLTNFWTAWNDTATVDSVITHNWMNTRTTGMFADDTHWPGLDESGNINADPGFGQAIYDVLDQEENSLFDWFRLCRTNALSTTYWGYNKTQVVQAADWVPEWPLPEAADLMYTNEALKTGATNGGPIGDPYWFTGEPSAVKVDNNIPVKFELSQNYPNPFNPATIIEFNIPEAGNVTLKVYDIMGREVMSMLNNSFTPAGNYKEVVNMNGMSSGVYFYKLVFGNTSISKKMTLLK